MPSSSNDAKAPCCAIFDAPLKTVVIILFQSVLTSKPSSYFNSPGTTVHPILTPVNPIDFENEFTSIATSCAPLTSNIDLGRFLSCINWLYAASKIIIDLFSFANSTSCFNCSFVATAPVGLLGEQKNMNSVSFALSNSGKNPFSGVHDI